MSVLLFALALAAQEPPPRIETCETQANTIEMNECGSARVALERERMERYLAAAREAVVAYQAATPPEYDVDLRAELDTAQAAFEAYYEAHCDAVVGLHIGGTIRGVMGLGCREDMIHQRTQRLWLDYLADAGTDLPEPTAPAAAAVLGE